MKFKSETNAAYAPTPELLAALDAVGAARDKCKRLAEQVDTTAAQAITLEADVKRLTAERAAGEGALALCDDADVKHHEKAVERLSSELDSKERELRRARAKIEALEGMAAGLDEEVMAKGTELLVEKGIWVQSAMPALSAELAEAVKPLLGFMAKARAISASICGTELFDFLAAAYVPDLQGFMRHMTPGNGWSTMAQTCSAAAMRRSRPKLTQLPLRWHQ